MVGELPSVERRCPDCGETKPLTDYYRDANRNKRQRMVYCKPCSNRRVASRKRRMRERRLEFIRAQKAAPCMDCGQQYPWYVMDFDHRGDEPKEFGLARARACVTRLAAEIAKCDLVCSNCHRTRTWRRANGEGVIPQA